jgi:hypothetical protein
MIQFLHNLAVFWVRKSNFFANFFLNPWSPCYRTYINNFSRVHPVRVRDRLLRLDRDRGSGNAQLPVDSPISWNTSGILHSGHCIGANEQWFRQFKPLMSTLNLEIFLKPNVTMIFLTYFAEESHSPTYTVSLSVWSPYWIQNGLAFYYCFCRSETG